MINLMQGDCLELMKDIPEGSVDMVEGVKNTERRITALDMAISALRARQADVTVDGNRWEGRPDCN